MTASPEGCGVLEHDPMCLCDVVIPDKTPDNYLAIPYEYENGEAIAYFGKWDGTVAHWCELFEKARIGLHEHRNDLIMIERHEDGKLKRTLPDEVYEYLVDGIREGKQPTPLRQEIIDRFNYTIHKSYVTTLRKRLQKRGHLQ